MTSRIEADPLDAEWRSSVVAGAPFMNIDLAILRLSLHFPPTGGRTPGDPPLSVWPRYGTLR
jgi:hypothetical protein